MSRKTTRKFLNLLEEGAVSPICLCEQLLNWMDESDVAAFALVHSYLKEDDDTWIKEGEGEDETQRAPHRGGRGFFDDIWIEEGRGLFNDYLEQELSSSIQAHPCNRTRRLVE
jgi:hypothetical protein